MCNTGASAVSLSRTKLPERSTSRIDVRRRLTSPATAQQIATRDQSNTRASPGSSPSLASLVTFVTFLRVSYPVLAPIHTRRGRPGTALS
jgi:hypothetical protein